MDRTPAGSATLIAFLLAILAVVGCESVTEAGFSEYEPELVVLSFFEPDSAWTAHVQHTVGVEYSAARDTLAVTDARVEIFMGDRVVADLRHVGDGVYVDRQSSPVAGQDYTIRVSSPGFPTATATDSIPGSAPVPSLAVNYAAEGGSSDSEANIRVEFDDPAGIRDYYVLRLYADRGAGVLRRVVFDSDDPILREGFVVKVFGGDGEFEDPAFGDHAFSGRSLSADLRISAYPVNRYVAEVLRISEPYYRYLQSLKRISEIDGNPFAEPAQPYTNFKGGRGVFAGFQRQRGEIELGEITPDSIAGLYQPGTLLFRTDDERRVYLIPGEAQFDLKLTSDGRVDGSIVVDAGFDPADPERSIDARLEGIYRYDGRFITFNLASDIFIEKVKWTYEYFHPCGTLRIAEPYGEFVAVLRRKCPAGE